MNELIVVEKNLVPAEIFKTGGSNKIIDAIKEEVGKHSFTVETAKGRKEIASLAHKISRSKTFLDTMGKNLKAEYKALIDPIDAERKKCRDELDKLKEQVRKPLSEWEAEQERIEKEKQLLEDWEQAIKENELFDREREVERKEAEAKKIEEERIEKERLEKERIEAEKRQKEREEQIRKEAAEKAMKEADEAKRKAAEEAERKIRQTREAEERAKREAEETKLRYERQLEQERQEQIRKQQEKERQEQELKERAERAEQARLADVEYKRRVNNSILADMVKVGISEAHAKELIKLIASNNVKYLSINY